MADYPERTVTAQTNMAEYERAMRIEKLRKKYGNMLWNVSALRGRGWANTSAAQKWKSAINSGGSSLTGLSTRLKMMKDADKEFVGNQLTSNFQDWLTANPDATIGSFNTWANEQGPWYEAERRARDQKVVKDRYDAMKSTKVAEAVDTLFGEYNDEWITGSYAEQNKVRQNIADSDAIKNLPSKWRASAVDEVIKMLNTLLSPTGRDAAAIEARRVQQEADRVTDLADARADEVLQETSEALSARVVQEAINLMDEDSNLTRNEALDKAIAMVVPSGRTQILDEQELKRRFDLFIPKKDPPPGTKPVYDPATDSTIFATDAEIAADDSLVPTAAESNLDTDTARIGALMAVKGDMPNEVWKKYYKGGMDLLYNSLAGPDAEHIKKWLLQVEEYKAKTAAGASINLQLLQGGGATGQTDDGITNVRIKQ